MSVLIQTFVPAMTSAQYDATTAELAPKLETYTGFLGFHTAAIVDGGIQITELWESSAAYDMWIKDVVATKVPAEAFAAMQTVVTPLHNVLAMPALALA